MLNVTNEVNQAWLQPSRQLEVKIFLNGEVYENDRVTSLSFEEESIVGESFQIGSTFINQLSVVFPEVIENLSIDQELTAEVGILVDETYHYSKLGKFIISECNRDRNNKTTTITALDQMILLEGVYDSKLTYPARIRDVALEIANLSGVEIDQVSFSTLPTTTIRKPEGYTHRQAIGLIAQFIGGFANFNRDGKLQVKRLNTTNFTIKPENYMLKGFAKNESTYRPNGITVRTGDEETDVLRVGSSSGNVISLENKVMTQPLLNSIWQYVKDITYFPFELKWQGNPNLEAGDWIYIEDREGIRYSVPNLSFSFTYNGGMRADSKATTTSNSEVTYRYRGTLKQQIEEIRGVLESATGGNHNYYDSETEPPNPKVGDTWFKKNGVNNEIWQYELVDGVEKWVLKISDAPNEALQQAIEQLGIEISEAKQSADNAVTKAEEARLAANFATDAADVAVTQSADAVTQAQQAKVDAISALEAYQNMEIGGRNFLRGSSSEWQDYDFTGWTTLTQTYTLAELGLSVGDTLYVSAEYDVISGTDVRIQVSFERPGLLTLYLNSNMIPVGEKGKVEGFGNIPSGTESIRIRHVNGSEETTRKIGKFRLTGVYKSTVPVDWSPAPEDVQIQITNINGELSKKVNQTTFNILDSTVSTQGTQINQNKADILLKANQTSVDTINNQVSAINTELGVQAGSITALNTKTDGHTTQIGSLQSSYSGLNSTVTTVRQDLDGLEIGQRNFLRGSSSEWQDYDFAGWVLRVKQYTMEELGLKSGDSLFLSGEFEAETGVGVRMQITVYRSDGLSNIYLNTPIIDVGSKGVSSGVVKIPNNAERIQISHIQSMDGNTKSTGRYRLTGVYKSNVPVDWTPAPEDLTTVQAFSDFQQTVQGFQTTVNNSITGLESQQTQMAGQITSVVADVSENTAEIATAKSQITQLSDQIDLRVTKADLISQINVQAGKVLIRASDNVLMVTPNTTFIQDATIKTAHIADLAVSGAKIANATISSAKIISLDVNKLVANNASVNKLSAISANLGDVTAGSITGVTITGGIITQTNNKYTMNMSNGALRFARGGSDIGYLGVANDASKNPIGMAIFQYPGEIFSIASLNSAGTTSSNVFVIPSSSSQGNAQWRLNGEGIIQAGSLAVNAPMTVEAAATFNRNVTLSRELNIGDSNREHKIFEDVSNYKLIFRSEYGYEFYYNRSNIYERMITIENNKVQIGGGSQGGDGYFNDTAAGMSFGRDGGTNAGGNRIWSRAIYNRTYSGSSNMYITDAGTIGRSTSARKYKTDIQVANQAIVNAQKVLQIQPSSWLDKAAVESGKSTHRYYGFIADDFHDKGLKEVVMYGSDGQVESLAYDRISMYHNVILADHEKQLRDIKNENMRLTGEISMLRNEVETLRQLVV